jgi:hypothetical protein
MKTLFFLESNENLIITDARNAHPRAYPARPRAHGRTPPARVRPRAYPARPRGHGRTPPANSSDANEHVWCKLTCIMICLLRSSHLGPQHPESSPSTSHWRGVSCVLLWSLSVDAANPASSALYMNRVTVALTCAGLILDIPIIAIV